MTEKCYICCETIRNGAKVVGDEEGNMAHYACFNDGDGYEDTYGFIGAPVVEDFDDDEEDLEWSEVLQCFIYAHDM